MSAGGTVHVPRPRPRAVPIVTQQPWHDQTPNLQGKPRKSNKRALRLRILARRELLELLSWRLTLSLPPSLHAGRE